MKEPPSSSSTTTEPIGQNLIKLISNLCFSAFVFSVLIFTVVAITYQPPDPWLESAPALTNLFTQTQNATFKTDDSVLKTGEDLTGPAISPAISNPVTELVIEEAEAALINNASSSSSSSSSSSAMSPEPSCDDIGIVNCSDPRVLFTIERFNLKVFKSIAFFDYQTPVSGSKPDECDASWRFRSKKEKSWRKYRDFRRFRLGFGENCSFKVVHADGWHSGTNARRFRTRPGTAAAPPTLRDDEINDTIPSLGSDASFRKGKYLYYSRGGDYCKGMNQYLWSFLCGLGEAMYLNRTFVMDFSICLSGSYNPSNKDEEGKDFRFYFDFEHLKEVASVVEEGEFIRDWRRWDRSHKRKLPVRRVSSHSVTPMMLRKDKSSVIMRQFDSPEPENYWYRVCEGQASKHVQRPWHAIWKSKRLMNIVTEISGQMDWDFDAVHVIRGEKARNRELWPNLDRDTQPGAILEKLRPLVPTRRNLYVATNEPFYNFFDKMRSEYNVHLLDDYKRLWGNGSEWLNETVALNGGKPVDFDGYMRVAVDTEVLYRAKTRVETFYNLTKDCKDGVNTC